MLSPSNGGSYICMRPIHSPHCACRFHNIYRGMALGTVLTTQSWYVKCIWVLKILLYWSDDIILNSRRDPAKFCKYLSKFHGIHDRLHGACCFRLQWVSHTSIQLRLKNKKNRKVYAKCVRKRKKDGSVMGRNIKHNETGTYKYVSIKRVLIYWFRYRFVDATPLLEPMLMYFQLNP